MDLWKMGHSLSPAGCCIVLSLKGFLRVKKGIAWSFLIVLGARFVRNKLLPSALVGSHYGGDSFEVFLGVCLLQRYKSVC